MAANKQGESNGDYAIDPPIQALSQSEKASAIRESHAGRKKNRGKNASE